MSHKVAQPPFRLEERFGDGRRNATDFAEKDAALTAFDKRLVEVATSSANLGVFNPFWACVSVRRLVVLGPDRSVLP